MAKAENLIGQKFGRLTVIEKDRIHIKPSGQKVQMWKCQCDCGNVKIVNGYDIKSGHTQSCGCLKRERISESIEINMEGMRYGRLTVIKKAKGSTNGTFWLCRCDCGNEKEILGASLRRGDVSSCGCYRAEKFTKHGLSRSRIRNVWRAMNARCYYNNAAEYKNYGGRGIKVCDEWRNLESFAKWAYANGYDENAERGKCTLDRINPDGNYEPSNCRWVSMKVQENNKRTNLYVEYNGETKTLSQWCDELNLKYSKIQNRITRKGWSIKRAFETE